MREARRTLGCWLLAAFLERGGDPSRNRVPLPVPLVRPLSGDELRRFAGPLAPVVRLSPAMSRSADDADQPSAAGRLLSFPARAPRVAWQIVARSFPPP